VAERTRISPWVWVGVGCLVPVLLIVAVVVGFGAWGYFQLRELQETMENPVARNEAAARTLGTDALPDGYHAMMSMAAPFGIMSTTMITDREPDADGDLDRFGEHGFVYFDTTGMGQRSQRLRDYVAGEGDEPEFFSQNPIRLNAREVIARGAIEEAGRTLRWVTYRGEVGGGLQRNYDRGLGALVMFDCQNSDRVRMGIWFGPDPSPETPPDETAYTGTVADPGAMQRFVAPFRVCG
jgi:hypothetical protein